MPVFFNDELSLNSLFVHIPKTGGTTIEQLYQKSGWRIGLRETSRSHPRLHPLRRHSPQHHHAALLDELFRVDRFDSIFLVTRHPIARFRSEWAMRNRNHGVPDEATVEAWAEKVLARYDANPYVLDNHIRPQHEFLLPGAQVYQLESGLPAIVDDLNQRFGANLSRTIPHAMNSQDTVPSSQVPISAKLRARLHDFYAQDFETFGYDD